MGYESATYEKRGRIAIVTINRPERMNSLHPPASFELDEIWNDFERDPNVWVGILTGAVASAGSWAGRPVSESGSYVTLLAAMGPDEAQPPNVLNVGYGAASLPVANWSGASPDEGRFPVRPSSLTPNGARRRTP